MHTERNVARRAAFTLVELLVVMAIIALLAGLLTPAILGAMNKAHEAATISRIRQCETAATAFFNDYGDYPPARWDQLDDIFKYDPEDDGAYNTFVYLTDGGLIGSSSNPNTINEGIEVFLACLATRTGGAYLEANGDWLRNVDYVAGTGDFDTDVTFPDPPGEHAVAEATNWYLGGNQVFELVDWWGNPLVYFHNRDYADCDGWDDVAGAWEHEDGTGTGVEDRPYIDRDNRSYPCYARSYGGTATRNYPNINSFQLYSWGKDGLPGRDGNPGVDPDDTSVPFPVGPDAGDWPGWTRASGNLTNWEE